MFHLTEIYALGWQVKIGDETGWRGGANFGPLLLERSQNYLFYSIISISSTKTVYSVTKEW